MVNTSYSAHFEWIYLACAILEVMQRKQEGEKKRVSGLASASRWRRFPVFATIEFRWYRLILSPRQKGQKTMYSPCGPPVLSQSIRSDYSASDERIKMRFFYLNHIFRIWFPFSHWTDLSFIWIGFSIWRKKKIEEKSVWMASYWNAFPMHPILNRINTSGSCQ